MDIQRKSHTSFFFIILYFINPATTCLFPDFLQDRAGNNTIRREWHSHVVGQLHKADSYFTVTHFKDNRMRTMVYDGMHLEDRPHASTRTCVLERNGRYLVQHQETGKEVMYLCMAFVSRSDFVMQTLESEMSQEENPLLCDGDELVLNKWPYVNRANLYTSFSQCTLHGGYNIAMYDKLNEGGVCDAFAGHTRVEVSCEEGEGMSLDYNGERLGTIPGADFARDYFGIWLGAAPLNEDFRDQMFDRFGAPASR